MTHSTEIAHTKEDSKCRVLIVNGGSFGKRIKHELEKKDIRGVHLVSTECCTQKRNTLYKTFIHAAAEVIDRKQYYSDYSIKIEKRSKINWIEIRDRIKEKIAQVEMKQAPVSTCTVKEMNQKIYIDSEECSAENIIMVNSHVSSEIGFNNIWIKLLEMESLPKRVFINGCNKHSIEAASMLSDLGSKVYLMSPGKDLMVGYDKNIQESVKSILLDKGVTLFFNSSLADKDVLNKPKIRVRMPSGIDHAVENVDLYLYEHEHSLSKVKKGSQYVFKVAEPSKKIGAAEISLLCSMYPNVFTPEMDYKPYVPCYIYTSPPVAVIGYTEEEAIKRYTKVRTTSSKFRGLFYSVCQNKVPTDYKIIYACDIDKEINNEEKLVGLHLFGKSSIDVIKGFAIGMHCGISPEEILKTIPIHPTSSEEVITG
ncbi:glutathione reductase (NADPH) [Nematocida minor]|uniref:glutathione reductase (NADPH) n=1 Tax=Nematocida minor TaxID=1912983 RepID=UPI002220A6C6|nr:glutathione reductase (NADPH) [Nematocida minor]KAI5192251.1 glutathione reductase (NADPH) [Nematocida minor]